MSFAHAVWVGSRAGVFVDGGSGCRIEAAYDISTRKAIPFASIERALAESIIHDYEVSPGELAASGGNVFAWATYGEDGKYKRSMEEFRKRYGN